MTRGSPDAGGRLESRSQPGRTLRDDAVVRVDVAPDQWGAIAHGDVRGPDGTVYTRRTTRMSRRTADGLVAAGAPLLIYWFGGGRLDWCADADAITQWQQLRAEVVSRAPSPGHRKEPAWTVGRWESSDGLPLLLLTARC